MNELVSFLGKIEMVVVEKGAFCVLVVLNLETKEKVCVKGRLLSPSKGDELMFFGKFDLNADGSKKTNNYNQFEFSLEYASFPPISDDIGLIKYLKKIAGDKTGERIFEEFGMESLKIMDESPDRLKDLPKIGQKKLDKILENHKEFSQRDTYIKLGKFMSENIIRKGLAHFGNKFDEMVMENPYITIELDGVQFLTADEIALKMGFIPNDPRRIEAGAIYEMSRLSNDGHCYSQLSVLSNKLSKTLKVSGEEKVNALEISVVVNGMCDKKTLIQEEDCIYLPNFYIEEVALAKRIANILVNFPTKKIGFDVSLKIPEVEKEFKAIYGDAFEFGDQQKELFYALENNLIIFRGGPGTGKTTTIRGALRVLKWAFPDYDVSAVAPTGKAGKRMEQSLGMTAMTIHRELGYDEDGFAYHEHNKLPKQIILVDEYSMVDLFLSGSLFKALEDGAKIIIIGDTDQLPSVGAGKVLDDLINCGLITTIHLTEVFRQAKDSGIIVNAIEVNEGRFPSIQTKKNDFRFIETFNPQDALDKLLDRLDLYSNFYPLEDIQILCPMKEGICGTKNLNNMLQDRLNPPAPEKKEFQYYDVKFREGDKVIQMKNDFRKLMVSNGDTGVIVKIRFETITDDEGKENDEVFIEVNIDGNLVSYEYSDLKNLKLGYAITVHKSQGSEWPIVLTTFTSEIGIMAKRNLLFTAMTRAKFICDLFGDRKTIWRTVKTEDTTKRNTTLALRIQQQYEFLMNKKKVS